MRAFPLGWRDDRRQIRWSGNDEAEASERHMIRSMEDVQEIRF